MSTAITPQNDRIGPVLRAMREGVKMSRRALAAAADVDHTHLARVETGERDISKDKLTRILQVIADRLSEEAAA